MIEISASAVSHEVQKKISAFKICAFRICDFNISSGILKSDSRR